MHDQSERKLRAEIEDLRRRLGSAVRAQIRGCGRGAGSGVGGLLQECLGSLQGLLRRTHKFLFFQCGFKIVE